MKTNLRQAGRVLGWVMLAGLLVVGPAVSEAAWRRGEPALAWVPAFFLGLLLAVAGAGLASALVNLHRGGWRWLATRSALGWAGSWLALLLSVVVVFYHVELWRGKRAYARVADEAKRLGEPLSLEALRPAPAADNDNIAMAPVFAPLVGLPEGGPAGEGLANGRRLGVLQRPWEWGREAFRESHAPVPWTRGMAVQLADLPRRGVDALGDAPDRVTAERLLESLASSGPMLEDVQSALARPVCHWPWGELNPLVSNQRVEITAVVTGLARMLEARALALLAADQSDGAAADVHFGLTLVDRLRVQPATFYTWSRAYGVAGLLQPVWEGMQRRQWTAEQLARLQNRLAAIDWTNDLVPELRLQFLTLADLVESAIPTGSAQVGRLPPASEDAPALQWVRRLYPRGWSLQDQAALHAFHFEVVAGWLDPGRPDRGTVRDLGRELMRRSSDPCFAVFLVPKAVQMVEDGYEFTFFAQATINLAAAACAVERWRLATGTYPEGLDDLVPNWMEHVPEDPVDGQPLRYGRGPEGRVRIYSVGMDGVDDGGTLPPVPGREGLVDAPGRWDWVWVLADRAVPPRD